MDFDLKLIGSLVCLITLQGGIVLAAAKSIFITKIDHQNLLGIIKRQETDFDDKLYDKHGIPLYVLKSECCGRREEVERRNDSLQVNLCDQLIRSAELVKKIGETQEIMRRTQESMNIAIAQLQIKVGEGDR